MRLLYIIGNGFDLNLGLKTSYKDFYNYYLKKKNENIVIQKIKNSIGDDFENWSDLELGFGKYTKEIQDQHEFDLIYEDIVVSLSDYLKRIQKDTIVFEDDVYIKKLYEDIHNPFKYLLEQNQNRIMSNLKNNINFSSDVIIDFMVFNYTQTVEVMIEAINKQNLPLNFGNVIHIHGEIDKHIIFGVNDVNQIDNKAFHSQIDIVEQLVKNKHNTALSYGQIEKCISLIVNADCVCVFGSSLGDTDNTWWKSIGERLKTKDFNVVVFSLGEKYPNTLDVRNNRTRRNLQKKFVNSYDILDNFYVAINSKMFKRET